MNRASPPPINQGRTAAGREHGATAPADLLHPGPDLHHAAEKSRLRPSFRDRTSGIRNAAAVLSDVALGRLRRRVPPPLELVLATGTSPSGDRLTAACAGTGPNGAWCLSTLFDDYRETDRVPSKDLAELRGMIGDIHHNVDVLFMGGNVGGKVDVPNSGGGKVDVLVSGFLDVPAWIKQRVRVLGDWPAQVDGLRRVTRQEVRRFLRKYEFGCDLTREPGDFAAFYDRLYKPYVSRRFGEATLVVERAAFLKECGRGVLLRVTRQDAVVGAALLRPLGRTLAVVWSALDSKREAAALRGVTDTLDYFSLLYAHLSGCRWLDLGPSRPDLCDGILRYKAKWGGEIHAGLVPQPRILVACKGQTTAQRDYLARHAFVTGTGAGFRAVMCVGGDAEPEAFAARLSSMMTAGVKDYRVVAMSPPGEALRQAVARAGANVTLVDAADYPDVLSAAR